MAEEIVRYAIHPGIGIARLGNAPEEFFHGPEVPGIVPPPPYKDVQGRVKRQAARFRIYGFDSAGKVVKEITAADAQIEWRVHIANRKAAWYQVNNPMDLGDFALESTFRNAHLLGRARSVLVIDPGPRRVSGVNQTAPAFDTGSFMGVPVYLGEIRTDEAGRLVVLGGRGLSAPGLPSYAPAADFSNNDGWHDDVADGPVRATLTIDGKTIEAEPATVVVAPPNFAQGITSPVTMYDVVLDLFTRLGWIPPADEVRFNAHIRPILHRLVDLQWVNQGFYILFGVNSPGNLTRKDILARLSDPSPASAPMRQMLFELLRKPSGELPEPAKLPPLYGDGHGDFPNTPFQSLSLTRMQYDWMERWALGAFLNEDRVPVAPSKLEALPAGEQPAALDRAALEDCLGGPFHPGFELTWILRVPRMWKRPFRLNIPAEGEPVVDDYGPILRPAIALSPAGPLTGSGPGALTRWMGVPWQTDAASCLSGYDASTYLPLPAYWPARVPNQVLPLPAYERLLDSTLPVAQRLKHFDNRQFWLRDLGSAYQTRINNMIAEWDQMGIVTRQPAPPDFAVLGLDGEIWVETGRGEKFLIDDPTVRQTVWVEDPFGVKVPMVREAEGAGGPAGSAVSLPRRVRSRSEH